MPDVVAKTMALLCGFLLLGAATILYVTSRPAAGANAVVAEFQDAFPLLEGMYVRVDGSIAGSVGKVEVNGEGLAEVTLILDEAIEDPSSDATAAIRQQDTTGDSYVLFEPGDSGEPLGEVAGTPRLACEAESAGAPCESTLSAPRFDDLLNAFGPTERTGVELVLLELSRALDGRGEDLNAAALELRPAMVAANDALSEVQSQNAALRAVIEDAEDVSGQAATKKAELARMIDALETTLVATAEESDSLDRGLERLPETVARTRSTMSALGRASEAGLPLAREAEARAPQLAEAIDAAPDFLYAADVALERAEPTLELTRRLLRAGAPTIEADPKRVVTGPFDLAPAISNLLTGVLGDENTIRALFGDDSNGIGPGTLDRFGLGAISVEPGNQPGYPAENANRNFVRISAVLNCTMFGVPVEPGCLQSVIGPRRRAEARDVKATGSDGIRRAPDPAGDTTPGTPDPPPRPPGIDDPLGGLDDVIRDVPSLPDRGRRPGGGGSGGGSRGQATQDLLDFLFGP